MSLFENPFVLARRVAAWSRAVSVWQKRLRSGDIDPSGPFIGTPELTERDAFREIRELTAPAPIQRAWTRWAFRLTEARVNAGVLSAIAHAYRAERHRIESPDTLEITLRELLHNTLERPAERNVWAAALSANSTTWRSLTLERAIRSDEIARRAGFANAGAIVDPVPDLKTYAERFRNATDDVYRAIVPLEFDAWLDAALALSANEGWPAQLAPRALCNLLGPRDWVHGLDLAAKELPTPIAAASFARALYQLGSALVEAAAPASEPFILAHDPYGLYRHVVGALCAGLPRSVIWQRDTLGLSRSKAVNQARSLLISQLIYARCCGLSIALDELACLHRPSFERDFPELCEHWLGFVLPLGFAGVLPQLRANAGQRFFGPMLAARLTDELVTQYDEDWYRNPRGIEAVRATFAVNLPTSIEPDVAAAAVDSAAALFNSS
ncbi:MAG TPA: hypothetical protein VIV60_29670 [Polyangiaceae bacterium]